MHAQIELVGCYDSASRIRGKLSITDHICLIRKTHLDRILQPESRE